MVDKESIFNSPQEGIKSPTNGAISVAFYCLGWFALGFSTIMFLMIIGSRIEFFGILYAIGVFCGALVLLALASIVGNLNKIAWLLQQQGIKIRDGV